MTTGNDLAKRECLDFLRSENEHQVMFVFGPQFVGKKTFLSETIKEMSEVDVLFVYPGVEGARDVRDFLNTTPTELDNRIVVIFDANQMQLTSQDAYLKVLEEPPDYSKIIFICDSGDNLSDAIKSRVRLESRWIPLSDTEFSEWSTDKDNEALLSHSEKLPGVYMTLNGKDGISEFIKHVMKIDADTGSVFEVTTPKFLKEANGLDDRHALSIIAKSISRSVSNIKTELLSMSSDFHDNISVNAELIWMKFLVSVHKKTLSL
jgi:hypothetical protein